MVKIFGGQTIITPWSLSARCFITGGDGEFWDLTPKFSAPAAQECPPPPNKAHSALAGKLCSLLTDILYFEASDLLCFMVIPTSTPLISLVIELSIPRSSSRRSRRFLVVIGNDGDGNLSVEKISHARVGGGQRPYFRLCAAFIEHMIDKSVVGSRFKKLGCNSVGMCSGIGVTKASGVGGNCRIERARRICPAEHQAASEDHK